MPRKREPSWDLKLIIWDIAARLGTDNLQAIIRQLDQELEKSRKEGDLFEDIPEERTIKRIINEGINRLPPEVVVSKLPQHVWSLRNDHEAIKKLAKKDVQTFAGELENAVENGREASNESGSLVAETGDKYSVEIRKRDREVFKKSDIILNEERLEHLSLIGFLWGTDFI